MFGEIRRRSWRAESERMLCTTSLFSRRPDVFIHWTLSALPNMLIDTPRNDENEA